MLPPAAGSLALPDLRFGDRPPLRAPHGLFLQDRPFPIPRPPVLPAAPDAAARRRLCPPPIEDSCVASAESHKGCPFEITAVIDAAIADVFYSDQLPFRPRERLCVPQGAAMAHPLDAWARAPFDVISPIELSINW
jgi:hypothetical protein